MTHNPDPQVLRAFDECQAEKARVNRLVTELAKAREDVTDATERGNYWRARAQAREQSWQYRFEGETRRAEEAEGLADRFAGQRDTWMARAERAEHDLELLMPESLKRGMVQAAAGEVRERPDLLEDDDPGDRRYWQEQAAKKDAELTGAIHRAEKAEQERETWEENHEILSEHYERMTRRALSAEETADWFKNDRDHWMDCAHGRGTRIERADEEIISLTAQARAWKSEAEKAEALVDKHSDEIDRLANEVESKDQRIADVEDVAENLDAELDAMGAKLERSDAQVIELARNLDVATLRLVNTEERAASWWEAAKILCRTKNEWEVLYVEQYEHARSSDRLNFILAARAQKWEARAKYALWEPYTDLGRTQQLDEWAREDRR